MFIAGCEDSMEELGGYVPGRISLKLASFRLNTAVT
jgi:hypothetical protein